MNQPFRVEALFDIYGISIEQRQCLNLQRKVTLVELENEIANLSKYNHRKISKCFNSDYQWKGIYNISNETFTPLEPDRANESCPFWRAFGKDRFMKITIQGFNDKTNDINQKKSNLIEKGLSFGGQRYFFVGGKEKDTISQRLQTQIPSTSFTAWYFACNVKHSINSDYWDSSFTSDYGIVGDEFISVHQLRYWLGDFSQSSLGKLNARLSLGFSISQALDCLRYEQLSVVEDILSVAGRVMTDGCGLIGVELARRIVSGITAGKGSGPREKIQVAVSSCGMFRASHVALPAVLQIRLLCRRGLFKGCLIVTSDASVCGLEEVKLRPSMHKAAVIEHWWGPEGAFRDRVMLSVVSTFERTLSSSHSTSSSLNKFECLLLRYLGVPQEVFKAFVNQQANRAPLTSREGVLQLIKHASNNSTDLDNCPSTDTYNRTRSLETIKNVFDNSRCAELAADNIGSCDMEDLNHLARQLTIAFDNTSVARSAGCEATTQPTVSVNKVQSVSPHMTDGMRAREFFDAGHDIDEPRFSQLQHRLQLNELRNLKECKIKMDNSQYLVGVPDPCNVLLAGQVYIQLYNKNGFIEPRELDLSSCSSTADTSEFRFNLSVPEGDVLVWRQPLLHPGDIRSLKAVYHAELEQFFRLSCGGVIVMSTQGIRSPADEMGGGDFDGDMYHICLPHNHLVRHVTAVNPYDYSSVTAKVASPILALQGKVAATPAIVNSAIDQIGWEIFLGLCEAANNHTIGKYSTAWLSWADKNSPVCPEALKCLKIVCQALDSAKTGELVLPDDRLCAVSRPHHCRNERNQNSDFYDSTSILGVLYDMIARFEVSVTEFAESRRAPLRRDPDLALSMGKYLATEEHELAHRWSDLCEVYNREIKDRISRKLSTDDVLGKFKSKFDQDCLDLYARTACDRPFISFPHCTLVGDFDNLGVRLFLASLVYEATYDPQKRRVNISGSYSLSFCWEVCGRELHYLKKWSLSKRTGNLMLDSIN